MAGDQDVADYVNAVVRGDVPDRTTSHIVVFCDRCGVEHDGDYIVSTKDRRDARLNYAREHMRTVGWRCDATGDFCPEHAAK